MGPCVGWESSRGNLCNIGAFLWCQQLSLRKNCVCLVLSHPSRISRKYFQFLSTQQIARANENIKALLVSVLLCSLSLT